MYFGSFCFMALVCYSALLNWNWKQNQRGLWFLYLKKIIMDSLSWYNVPNLYIIFILNIEECQISFLNIIWMNVNIEQLLIYLSMTGDEHQCPSSELMQPKLHSLCVGMNILFITLRKYYNSNYEIMGLLITKNYSSKSFFIQIKQSSQDQHFNRGHYTKIT